MTTANSAARYPPGATNANWFGLFNAMSWQIALGTPVILYAKSQGASSTILGVIAAFTPLLVIFQIPAAHWLPRYGYRRFILAGWGTRSIFIFGMAGVPLLVVISPWSRLALVLLCLFAFNLIRGIASGAWLPWMSELIPQHLRGRFLSRDMVFSQIGSLVSLGAAAAALRGNPRPWQFALVFLISAVSATVSLWFVKRIPDVTAPEKLRRSGHRVPWREMLFYPPFFRLTVFNLLWVIAVGGLGVFTVAWLRGTANYSESRILWLSTLSVLGGLATVPWTGRFLDREGSKPVLRLALAAFILILAGWWSLASHLLRPATMTVALLNVASGIAGVSFSVANSRLMMATMPIMGRNHFFALFTVITSMGLGISPIAWGVLLDAIGHHQAWTGAVAWNRYSVYFGLVVLLCVAVFACAGFLHERPRGEEERGESAPPEMHEGTA